MSFKVPNRQKKKTEETKEPESGNCSKKDSNVKVVHLHQIKSECLPGDRRITRGSVKAWQEGHCKPWCDLPGLRLRFANSVEVTTSDYGTASESSHHCSSSGGVSPREPCRCETMSGINPLCNSEDDEGYPEPLGATPLNEYKWNSDSEDADDCESSWDEDFKYSKILRHEHSRISAIIPLMRRSNKLNIRVLKDTKYTPKLNVLQHHISEVVSLEPHGLQFHPDYPAHISIPVNIQDDRNIVCLYSNTEENETPKWEKLPSSSYKYREGFIIITVNHFSLFTLLYEDPYPESLKRIRRRVGGTLKVSEVPGVEVTFPRGCLDDDIDAYLRVLYDCETLRSDLVQTRALASPIIMIGPHGHQFNQYRPAVKVTLPIPDLLKICERFNISIDKVVDSLIVYQSPTMEFEPIVWERLNTEIIVDLHHSSGVPVVTFNVHHFSFFTVIWDILSASLYEAKMGVAYFYPYITFSMMCEAFMQETPNTNRFGLEVICYRSDRRLPEMSNLQHRVGSSVKPKLVRPGKLLVRLKSQLFEADEDAGEEDLCKEEPDFKGRDFEKQYCCRFKTNVKIEFGAIGKVLVEKMRTSGKNDSVFEFNIYKSGNETEPAMADRGNDRWCHVAIKELAGNLQLTEDNNWKKIAKHIGFTRSEIRSKFMLSPDPFMSMLSLYDQRGGTPEEFVQALYAVSREIRMNIGKHTPPSSSSHGSVSPSHSGSSMNTTTPRRTRFPWPFSRANPLPPPAQGNSTEDDQEQEKSKPSSSQKRSHPSSGKSTSNNKYLKPTKRRKRNASESSDTPSVASSSDSDGPSVNKSAKSSEANRANSRKLSDNDLWSISKCMTTINWRSLGRTLGIDEGTLHNISEKNKQSDVRECVYYMLLEWKSTKPKKCTLGVLYKALCSDNRSVVAREVMKVKLNDESS